MVICGNDRAAYVPVYGVPHGVLLTGLRGSRRGSGSCHDGGSGRH